MPLATPRKMPIVPSVTMNGTSRSPTIMHAVDEAGDRRREHAGHQRRDRQQRRPVLDQICRLRGAVGRDAVMRQIQAPTRSPRPSAR